MPRARKAKAVFLDRDGTLNEEVNYLHRVEDLKLIPGAGKALAALRKAGFKTILVSNQSGVARGYFTRSALLKITRALEAELAKTGGKLDAVYYCCHGAERGATPLCGCRKPSPLMLKRAARRFGLDLSQSYFIGDSTGDVKTAENAGCAGILVRTGHGGRDKRYAVSPAKVAANLPAAARWILSRRAR